MIRSWFECVDAMPSSIAIRESIYGYPALLTAHVVSMCLFSGLIIMMDLRLVGWAFSGRRCRRFRSACSPGRCSAWR